MTCKDCGFWEKNWNSETFKRFASIRTIGDCDYGECHMVEHEFVKDSNKPKPVILEGSGAGINFCVLTNENHGCFAFMEIKELANI